MDTFKDFVQEPFQFLLTVFHVTIMLATSPILHTGLPLLGSARVVNISV